MKKIYAEIGLGNPSFLSTEIEECKKEYRIAKLIFPKKKRDFYLRVWILNKVFIISTLDGFVVQNKKRNDLKLLFGIGGTN